MFSNYFINQLLMVKYYNFGKTYWSCFINQFLLETKIDDIKLYSYLTFLTNIDKESFVFVIFAEKDYLYDYSKF
ncbi:hypothetical protein HMPREF9071_1143 [Capnocytophaga sp. oral taxon 338 str. F0234]|nr:hypothetical protein HMPREF9071_1143 [Capnocytophaga sp. oral taxon 338 str. F0234]